MSASPHYQSRLFNFLTDRAVRLGDRAARVWRQAQITATTVARTVLLPLWSIAETLGIQPPQLPGFGRSFTDRSVFSPGVDDDRKSPRDRDADAPIRATLTILEAAGWPTVDRLDRDALQPAKSDADGDSPTDSRSAAHALPDSPEQQKNAKNWLQVLWEAIAPTSSDSSTQAEPPAPLALQMSERELLAIAPAKEHNTTSPIRGLASELGRNELVLVSAKNEIVAHLGLFPQQTLDRDVEILLDHLAPIALPPAPSGLAALPTSIHQLVQPLITSLASPVVTPVQTLLTRLDTQLADLDGRLLPPSGFAIARTFDLHAEFTESALESAIETPLDALEALPSSNLKALESSFKSSFNSVGSLTRSLPRRLSEAPKPETPQLEAPNRDSHTTIDGSQWSIDPGDPWWRNALDLTRAAITGAVTAIVAVAKPTTPRSESSNSDNAETSNTDPHPEQMGWMGQRDHPLRSKTANRLRTWFSDHANPAHLTVPADHTAESDLHKEPEALEEPEAPIVATSPDSLMNAKRTSPANTTKLDQPDRESAPQGKAIAQPASRHMTTKHKPDTANGGMEFDPDWIETEVNHSQYVMHPLERVLRWLDRGMAAIEGWLERAIKAVAQWWSRRRDS